MAAVVEEMLVPSLLSFCAPEVEEEVNGGTIVRGRYNSMEAMRLEEHGRALLDCFFIVVCLLVLAIDDDDDVNVDYNYNGWGDAESETERWINLLLSSTGNDCQAMLLSTTLPSPKSEEKHDVHGLRLCVWRLHLRRPALAKKIRGRGLPGLPDHLSHKARSSCLQRNSTFQKPKGIRRTYIRRSF